MPQVTGTLKAVREKSGTNKQGKPYTLYQMAVDRGDGDYSWFGCGFDKPSVAPESVITFEASKNSKGYDVADVSTITLDKQASGAQGQTQSNAAPQGQSFGADRQRSITLQTSFKVASHVAQALVENKLMPLPPANSKEKKETAMEAYLQTVDQLAARYQGYFSDPAKFEEKFLADFAEGATDESPDEDGDEIPW